MYGLPSDIDLSFFCGTTLSEVRVTTNDMILTLDEGDVELHIESPIRCAYPDGMDRRYDSLPEAASTVAILLAQTVVSAEGDTDGTLNLGFSGGGHLYVYDDSDHYESYNISYGEGTIVV